MNGTAPRAYHAKQRQHPVPRQSEYSDEVEPTVNYVLLQARSMHVAMGR